MKATGERCDRCLWQKKGAERVAAVDRCQGAPSTQADVGHRNRHCQKSGCSRYNNTKFDKVLVTLDLYIEHKKAVTQKNCGTALI